MSTPLPDGFAVHLDAATKEIDAGVWFGGSPSRVLRLTPAGRAAWARLRSRPVSDAATGRLARRLTDAGQAHPRPPRRFRPSDVTVVVPVRDRAEQLDECLHALGGTYAVIVVDDGSADPVSIGAVADRHGAKLLRRDENGGPGVARDTGLDQVSGDYVAFIDSDCTPPRGGWLHTLAGHFADPAVGAVAARIVPREATTWAARYGQSQSSLDLGPRPARVLPGARIAYVPTAALIARCSALRSVAVDGHVFDPQLRVGEDVDLIWRLHEAGWRIRYDPSAVVEHAEPADWPGLLKRRHTYGTSAAPLAKRHGAAVAPFAIHTWPTLTVLAAVARRPVLAAAAFTASVTTTTRLLRAADVPTHGVVRASAEGVRQTWLGLGRYAVQLFAPLLLLAGVRRRWRAGVASLVFGPPLVAWARQWRRLDPIRFTLGWLADQLAYGAGVWRGCLRHRTTVPLRPVLVRRPVRTEVDRAPSGTEI